MAVYLIKNKEKDKLNIPKVIFITVNVFLKMEGIENEQRFWSEWLINNKIDSWERWKQTLVLFWVLKKLPLQHLITIHQVYWQTQTETKLMKVSLISESILARDRTIKAWILHPKLPNWQDFNRACCRGNSSVSIAENDIRESISFKHGTILGKPKWRRWPGVWTG